MNDVQAELSRSISRQLKAMRWNQNRLAREAGVTAKHLSGMLNGQRQGTLDMWSRLFATLGCAITLAVHPMSEADV